MFAVLEILNIYLMATNVVKVVSYENNKRKYSKGNF